MLIRIVSTHIADRQGLVKSLDYPHVKHDRTE